MDVDPAASMRIWAVEFELGGRIFEVPALPAADWFPLLVQGDTMAVINLIRESEPDPEQPEAPDLDEMILNGQVTVADLEEAVIEIIEQVSGRSLNATLALVQIAQALWTRVVGGELARCGFRWDEVSLGTALDAIYTVVMGRLKPEAAQRFQAIIDSSPGDPGQRRRPNRQKAMAEFEEMAGPKPQPVKATAGPSGGGRPRTRPRPPQRPQAGR